jgi:hypothetical protein
MEPSNYHPEWVESRTRFITNYFNHDLTNKTVLELGAFNGDIGGNLAKLGARITSAEGRKQNLLLGRRRYPKHNWMHVDLDIEEWAFDEKYDIIIHFGVLYHLKNPDFYLREAQKRCNHFFLESEVLDNSDKEITNIRPSKYAESEGACGQGLNCECQLSTRYIENRLTNFKRFDLEELNGGMHYYNWESKNDNSYKIGRRRFWVCGGEGDSLDKNDN